MKRKMIFAAITLLAGALFLTSCEIGGTDPVDNGTDKTVTIAAINGVTQPMAGGIPVATIIPNDEYTGTVSWDPADNPFQENTTYTATITLEAKAGYTLNGVTENFFEVAGAASVTYAASTGVITAEFPATGTNSDTVISIATIAGVTQPALGETPVLTITPNDEYTGTVSWSPNQVPFQASTVYTATITLTPKAGYTLNGVSANFFEVAGADAATNAASTGVITAKFPATDAAAVSIAAISGVSQPLAGGMPVAAITPNDEYEGTVSWDPTDATFQENIAYTATITLEAKAGYTLDGVTENFFEVAGADTVTYDAGSKTVTVVFPVTAERVLVTENAIGDVSQPLAGGVPVTEITLSGQYTGSVSWDPADATFQEATVYTATITLAAEPGYTLDGLADDFFTVEEADTVTYDAGSKTVTVVFPVTAGRVSVTEKNISGVTPPVVGQTPATAITPNDQYTGTVSWDPADATFQGNTAYTATITLEAKAGYTLDGVTENFFAVDEATSVTNAVGSGVITVVFPTTPSIVSRAAIDGVELPVIGQTPATVITQNDEYTGSVSWNPADDPFQESKVYTATITLTAEPGYTLDGLAENFFTIAGATSVTNAVGSGVITVVFPATPSIVSRAAIDGVTPPVIGQTPPTVITQNDEYTGTVSWNPADATFQENKTYTATITLEAKAGYTLDGVTENFFTVAEADAVTNAVGSGVITVVFPATPSIVSRAAIDGVTPPVIGQTPATVITPNDEYTGTVSWDPTDATFQGNTVYTATIALTAEPGYTLNGVTENFFTVAGADTVTNAAGSGVITVVFPTTPSIVSRAAIDGVELPVIGQTPPTVITPNDEYTGTVSWNPADATFQENTVYTATITLTAEPGYTLNGVTENFFTVAGATLVTNDVGSGVITVVFPTTPSIVSRAAIDGVELPVIGQTPATVITPNDEYTGTVSWNPSQVPFQASTIYTATITLEAKAGYTLNGVSADFFEVEGADTVTNAAGSGVIIVVFPATPSIVSRAAIDGVELPVVGETPVTTITPNGQYTGTVSWNPADATFQENTAYTATITLTAKAGYTLDGLAENFFTVDEATSVTNTAGSGVITVVFPTTPSIVSRAAIDGVELPVAGGTPVAVITPNEQYTGSVSWSPNHAPFQGITPYTATITLVAEPGYTLNGVTADFFTVAGADSVTNAAGSGTITAVFPATGEAIISMAEIGVTQPAVGETPVTTITPNDQYTGTVSWSPADDTFQISTLYTATITLVAEPGYTLNGVPADFFTVAGADSVTNAADSGIITVEFPEPLILVRSVSSGGDHTMILKADGTLWATGANWNGQLGSGNIQDEDSPVEIMSNVASVSAGIAHTMIVEIDGTLWATGNNGNGQLGDGTTTNARSPVEIMSGVASVSTGDFHTMILKTDGTLWATGWNGNGRLGDGTTTERHSPVEIMSGVASVSAGDFHTMILKTDGTLWATGGNGNGQLGDGTTVDKNIPVQIMSDVALVSAGDFHTMILKTDGTLWATGGNWSGQLGDGTTTERHSPVEIMSGVASVSGGEAHTMILKADGTLWATGVNDRGQLGDGTTTERHSPVEIMSDVASVSAGEAHTMIIKTDGTLWATGKNDYGQLGDGTTTERHSPVAIF